MSDNTAQHKNVFEEISTIFESFWVIDHGPIIRFFQIGQYSQEKMALRSQHL
jgi:hypothetical protein